MKYMAEVLHDHREHALCYDHEAGWCCICGEHDIDTNWRDHVAAALTAAGFGPVKEAAAKALEDAADELELPGCTAIGYYASEQDSGYSEAERHTDKWLRARAAAVRGQA